MPTDRELLKQQQAGTLGGAGASDPIGEVAKAHQLVYVFTKAADDGLAATATAEFGMGVYLPFKAKLVDCRLLLRGATALVGHATNYASLLIDKYASDGTGNVNLISFATSTPTTDDLAVKVPKSIMGDAVDSALVCDAGSILTFQITKAASGVIVPALDVITVFEAV